MANALTTLTNTIMAQEVFKAYTDMLTPLRAFATDFSAEAAQRGDKVQIPYVAASDTAATFAGTYNVQDADATGAQLTIDKHKYVSWGLSDSELSTRPQLELQMFAQNKAAELARAVLVDVWSLITNANYSTAAHVGTAANFDTDDVADIREDCVQAKWPNNMRSLILDETYITYLLKDDSLKDFSQSGSTATLREGSVGRVHGFDVYESTLIPANGENLTGFAARPDGIYVAGRYLEPQANHDYHNVQRFTDAETGITLGYREWYDNDTGTSKVVMEAIYGYLKGSNSSIKRVTSS